jgi:hypothetical protein
VNRGLYFVFAGVALVGFAVAFVLGLRLLGPPPPPEPDGTVITTTPVQPPAAPPPEDLAIQGPSAREVATTDAFTALAKTVGVGRVLCELPAAGLDESDRLRGLDWQSRFDDRIYALVPEPAGATSIGGPDPSQPAFVAFWTDAVPGEPGVCTVEKRRILEHRVTLATPGAEVVQHDCHDVTVDGPTVLIAQSIAHLPCTITARHDGTVGQLVLDETEPTNDAVLALDGAIPPPEAGPTVAVTAAHLEAARDTPGLSPEARLLLKRLPPTAP